MAGPIGKRRAGDNDRAEQLRRDRGKHHDRPTRLAVADHAGLTVGIGVQLDNSFEEGRLGAGDILDGLTGHGVGQEALSATPISLSALKPPMPGPCPARGSTMTNGRSFGSIVTPSGGTIRTSP